MKICFLNNDLTSNTGSGKFCLSLIKALQEISPGLEIKVLTHKDILGHGWPRGVSLRGWLALVFCRCFKLRSIFIQHDIIHALDGWPYGLIAAVALLGLRRDPNNPNASELPERQKGFGSFGSNSGNSSWDAEARPKLIITVVGTGAVQPLYQPIKKRLLAWAYRRADKLVAVSNNTRREILKVLPDLKIEVINHGVDFFKFQVPSSKFQEIENLKPYILSVGALKKRKGYEYSIKAFAEVSKKFPDLKYVIVGQGPELANIQFLISNFQLKNKVIIFPKVEEDFLIGLYRNAELFILLPQDYNKDIEGFGLVFLEAAAAGLPVIATKATSAEDAVLNGRNGILVPSGDHEGAAWALGEILSSTGLRSSLASESVKLARSMSWERVANRYICVYRDIMRVS